MQLQTPASLALNVAVNDFLSLSNKNDKSLVNDGQFLASAISLQNELLQLQSAVSGRPIRSIINLSQTEYIPFQPVPSSEENLIEIQQDVIRLQTELDTKNKSLARYLEMLRKHEAIFNAAIKSREGNSQSIQGLEASIRDLDIDEGEQKPDATLIVPKFINLASLKEKNNIKYQTIVQEEPPEPAIEIDIDIPSEPNQEMIIDENPVTTVNDGLQVNPDALTQAALAIGVDIPATDLTSIDLNAATSELLSADFQQAIGLDFFQNLTQPTDENNLANLLSLATNESQPMNLDEEGNLSGFVFDESAAADLMSGFQMDYGLLDSSKNELGVESEGEASSSAMPVLDFGFVTDLGAQMNIEIGNLQFGDLPTEGFVAETTNEEEEAGAESTRNALDDFNFTM
ncbi:hypothetical protein HK098_003239 [Nowakowskiella sp. JEL0407]|nr:hypothetical protein HK098_003239 [Nowakowskiella sp. JEL0407]